ncbi:aldo/keto reductase [Mumia sp. zg.B21]|uniref:aldo/keto reductase n=1 Tax=Mumia sp. zg.B21 TaxID=2855447 RepID=UPI001C6E168C|nr:aldo/keto reductase [Mumia sp. zg.B21]MBW9209517.1 aldo/keto reductase [Mumia sp. zg.B21]
MKRVVKRVAVLQARISSTRLPAKVALPVAGLPLVVLAARRAARAGMDVVVATSTDPSDDLLADLLTTHGVRHHRGSLSDTLERFVEAVATYDDHDVLVRLTADNALPDGDLLEEVVDDFLDRELGYLSCNGTPSGLPYGLSAEVVRVGSLRKAHADPATTDADREHVTPAIVRRHGFASFTRYADSGLGALRATVDQLDDYVRISRLFDGIDDPVAASALDLATRLRSLPGAPVVDRPVDDLVVGTAQLGMDYGIANTSGRPTTAMATVLVRTALTNGVTILETARAYGASEETIGVALAEGWQSRAQVFTKLSTLEDCPSGALPATVHAFVDQSVLASCHALRRSRLDVLSLHRAAHLEAWDGEALARLRWWVAEGTIGTLGVSVQTPDELRRALALDEVTVVQLPFNLLDHRWDDVLDDLAQVRAARPLTVHARSALLQGLLIADADDAWRRAGVTEAVTVRSWLRETTHELGRADVVDLALAFVRAQNWIDAVVLGMESLDQLSVNLSLFQRPPLTPAEVSEVLRTRPWLPESTLDPASWEAL